MRRKKGMAMAVLMGMTLVLAACGSKDKAEDVESTASTQEEAGTNGEQEAAAPTSVVKMREQGNPIKVQLADIAEANGDTYKAWIKVSTQFDPELSMYSADTLAEGTQAVIVDFTVTDLDVAEAVLEFQYQLTSGEVTTSVWDDSSPADKLTITADGNYRMVFDAQTALGGTLDAIDSFQIVFPCGTDTTTTEVTVTGVSCITDRADLTYFATGAVE